MQKPSNLLLLLIALQLLNTVSAYTQNRNKAGTIKGRVLDGQQTAAAYATVCLYKSSDSTVIKRTLTTAEGDFLFEELVSGIYLVSVEWIGYKKLFSDPITIKTGDKPLVLNSLVLIAETKQLNAVNITSKKPLVETRNGKMIVNVEGSILAAGKSAMEILAKAPGVTVDQDGRISLRGKSGVEVMINGKLTYLSAGQLANLLRSTSGNTIQRIELMSQPGSAYDASGSAGIINIKLKKNDNYGTNGNVTAGFGYGRYYKSNGGLTINHRTKSLNIFGNYDLLNNRDFEDLKVNRSNTSAGEKSYFDQQAREVTTRKNHSYKAGLDYFIDDKNTLGFVFNGYTNHNTSLTDNRTNIGNRPSATDSTILASNPGRSSLQNQAYNLNYKSVIDTSGQEFSADIDYSKFQNNNETAYNNYFYNGSGMSFKDPLIFRNATPSTVKIWTGKADYVYPLSDKSKLEAGIKSSSVRTDNHFQFDNLKNGNWFNDLSRSNTFIYKEFVNAVYASTSMEFAATNIVLGLRGELTHSEGNSPTVQQKVERNYFNLFPSLSVGQKLSELHDIGLSYSRRIDRPDYQSLNPFLYFADLYTYNQGNPLLKPQYTNAFEFTYGYKKILNATVGYSHTSDVITTTLITDTVAKTLIIKDQNLASQHTFNFNVSMPVTISKWWNTTNNGTLYYTSFNSPDLLGAPFHSGKTTYLLSSIHTFTLTPAIHAELSANYQSAQVYGTYAVKPIYSIDLGLSKSFANQRANLKFAAGDLFNWAKARVTSAIPSQDYQLYQKQESRIFRLTFSYNFGSSLVKAVRAHTTGADAEQKRVKSGN
ncbi:TonB-dependent receptor [Pedobacter hartonius]|uniref:Outer membrane receptor proteins, mostly Fe transport n=1 Tax=Pedobacter hartonius TaxID=425514 RepID=A0A1H3WC40_9SPHI|nr:TonB-dependent receptor [Pedobacter hartonius]SDZ83828.1 Outer membrane receptor proteins, mostly Fe transport [Pedobacter hartonius]